ncbi:hypothetical protein, partial [Ruegeria sp. HKCCD8929]|uniref:hypothetical protein n=1 Tax=Ruegeria sp. HKCCD8929 TaxID=2683006 RepID=UPI001C2C36F7
MSSLQTRPQHRDQRWMSALGRTILPRLQAREVAATAAEGSQGPVEARRREWRQRAQKNPCSAVREWQLCLLPQSNNLST